MLVYPRVNCHMCIYIYICSIYFVWILRCQKKKPSGLESNHPAEMHTMEIKLKATASRCSEKCMSIWSKWHYHVFNCDHHVNIWLICLWSVGLIRVDQTTTRHEKSWKVPTNHRKSNVWHRTSLGPLCILYWHHRLYSNLSESMEPPRLLMKPLDKIPIWGFRQIGGHRKSSIET